MIRRCVILSAFLSIMILLVSSASAQMASSSRSGKQAKNFTIAIDAGHCSDTAGKRSCPFKRKVIHRWQQMRVTVAEGEQFREHYANAAVAFYLDKILKGMGFKTVKVAWDDINGRDDHEEVSLGTRQSIIRNSGADISVSCHYNAFGDGQTFNSAHGVGVYIHSQSEKAGDSQALAQMVQNQLVGVFNQRDRGVSKNEFAMCNCSATGCKASILLELAFMTHQQEAEEYFCNPEAWYRYADATARGICEYLGVPYTHKTIKKR